MSTVLRRYWSALSATAPYPARPMRSWQGYGLWRRYWCSLLGFGLPAREPVVVARTGNPLAEPSVQGSRIKFPRFDRLSMRMAASEEPGYRAVEWIVGSQRFDIRESGPGTIEVLVHDAEYASAERLLPMDVTTESSSHRYFMVFVPSRSGGGEGALRLTASRWLDLSVSDPVRVTEVDSGDPAALDQLARSVAATPDPAMPAWAAIVASLPGDDPVSRTIRDAAV
ncbi:hypothetical protein [Actinoplanes sp. NPDC020271]|uniref:hypothetical protein n=1 Tax=Actinoplanes sp. NPDC020271 TaxID=3363896 RepID=UPI003792C489